MSLVPGSRLDAYELVSPLGSGGMGEVWLATEVRLGRKVALKLLPAELTRDPARVSRFEQEARAASALSHPNVCTIHALGETSEGQHYIAMEYVEGETLRKRLSTSRLTIRESLDIAIQIASAVSAAHAAGIVHRDIKPENVMLRPDGFVKVLDFGLAKLTFASEVLNAQSTQTAFRTDAGAVVGTMTYMSPEQARGQQVDHRTDIWALGCVLYEMVAGRSPFAAPSGSEVLAAILQNDPAALVRFEAAAPAEAQRIVTKTLRKDRTQRYQSVQDLLLDLQALRDASQSNAVAGSAAVSSNDAGAIGSGLRVRSSGRNRVRRLVAGATLITVAGAAAAWWRFGEPTRQSSGNSGSIARPLTRLTFGAGLQTGATWSPDGRSVAYASDEAGNFDIWVQSLAGGPPAQVTRSSAQDTEPSWSPDGRSLAFRSDREGGGLYVVPALGGPERQLTSFGTHPEWTADGSDVLFRSSEAGAGIGLYVSLHAVSADGGTPPRELLRAFLEGGNWSWVASHPDGRISALGRHRDSGAGFYTVSRDGRQITRSALARRLPLPLGEGSMASGRGTRVERFAWNPTGTAVYVEALVNEVRNIWRVHVEPTTLAWQSADQLTGGTGADVAAALSRDGSRLVFTTERRASRLWVFPLDAAIGRVNGEGTVLTPEDEMVGGSDLAPDGSKAVYLARRPGGKSVDLWVVDIASAKRELLAQDVLFACWSPDGKALAYSLVRPAAAGEWAVAVRALSGPERLVGRWSADSAYLVSDWTRDGTAILGSYIAPLTGAAALALWSSSGQRSKPERVLLKDPPASLWQGRFSPDGRWLSFVVTQGEESIRLMVAPASGAPPSGWIRLAADHLLPDKPRWAPDGRILYFISRHREPYYNLWGIRFDRARGVPVGMPFRITNFSSPRQMISPDIGNTETGIAARRALLTLETVSGSVWMLDNVDK